MKKWLPLTLLFISMPIIAYTPIDNATIDLKLSPEWKSGDITRAKNLIATTYIKNKGESYDVENLVEVQLKKESNKDPIHTIERMGKDLVKQAKEQGCNVEKLTVRPQSHMQFRVWSQVIQCKKAKTSLIQLYVDADPKNIYMFTYTTSSYPLTPAIQKNIEQFFQSSIFICYKENNCHSID